MVYSCARMTDKPVCLGYWAKQTYRTLTGTWLVDLDLCCPILARPTNQAVVMFLSNLVWLSDLDRQYSEKRDKQGADTQPQNLLQNLLKTFQ